MSLKNKSDCPSENFIRALINVLFFFRSELKQERGPVIIFLSLIFLASLMDFIPPYFSEKLIDSAIPEKKLHLISWYAFYIVSSIMAGYVLNVAFVRYAVKIKENIIFAVRGKLMRRILSKDSVFFDQHASSDILTRFSSDIYMIGEFFYDHLLVSLVYLISGLAFTVWLFYLNWLLALCSCSFYIVYISVAAVTYRPIVKRARLAQDRNSEQNDTVLDIIHGETDIRVYQQKAAFLRRFHKKGQAYAEAQINSAFLAEAAWISLEKLSLLSAVIPIILGAFLFCFNRPDITIGLLVAFSQVMFYCSKYISYIAYTSIKSSSIAASIDRVNELLDKLPEKEIAPVKIDQTPDSADIEFRDITFAYPSGKTVFKRLNLSVKSGEKIAIMAPSGFGKTTFTKLLLRLCEPSSGTVFFGGKDIRSYPQSFYLTFISYVCCDTHIFKLSVRDNIEMGWTLPDEAKLQKLIKTLKINDYIDALPDKADTILNSDGISLSVGQKQRIKLARALIRDPQIIVLDEFTSALDRGTEDQILSDLLSVMGKQTIICITHSQNVASKMDRTIFLPDVSG